MIKNDKKLRKEGLEEKRKNQLYQILNNAIISNYDKMLLKKEIDEGFISNKNILKQRIREKPKKLEDSIEFKKENKYKKNNPYKKKNIYKKNNPYKKKNEYKKPKPIIQKNYRDGLNRQCSIYGVMMVDLIVRDEEEEKIYDELNVSLAKNTHNRTWRLLKDALKKYPDNPVFLYYKSLELYRTKNFDYADKCISSAVYNAKKYGLSDHFMRHCYSLLHFDQVRNNIYKRKVKKRPGRPRYKNSKY